MTFGSTFGRTFSPTFQPSSQAAAGGGWWDLNGTIIRAEYSNWFSGGQGWQASADAILANDRPVWALVDFDRDTGAIEQHWVLIIGKAQGQYWAYDPWIGAIASLAARYDSNVFRVVSYRKKG